MTTPTQPDASHQTVEPPDAHGELALRAIAMPADANPNGDVFGGWILSQMDLAGAVVAQQVARGRIATVAVEAMKFIAPVFIGDLVSCFGRVQRVGTTSIQVHIEIYAHRRHTETVVRVTEGVFTYVAIDEKSAKRRLPRR